MTKNYPYFLFILISIFGSSFVSTFFSSTNANGISDMSDTLKEFKEGVNYLRSICSTSEEFTDTDIKTFCSIASSSSSVRDDRAAINSACKKNNISAWDNLFDTGNAVLSSYAAKKRAEYIAEMDEILSYHCEHKLLRNDQKCANPKVQGMSDALKMIHNRYRSEIGTDYKYTADSIYTGLIHLMKKQIIPQKCKEVVEGDNSYFGDIGKRSYAKDRMDACNRINGFVADLVEKMDIVYPPQVMDKIRDEVFAPAKAELLKEIDSNKCLNDIDKKRVKERIEKATLLSANRLLQSSPDGLDHYCARARNANFFNQGNGQQFQVFLAPQDVQRFMNGDESLVYKTVLHELSHVFDGDYRSDQFNKYTRSCLEGDFETIKDCLSYHYEMEGLSGDVPSGDQSQQQKFLKEAFADDLSDKILIRKFLNQEVGRSDVLNQVCNMNGFFREKEQANHVSMVGTLRAKRLLKKISPYICKGKNKVEVDNPQCM